MVDSDERSSGGVCDEAEDKADRGKWVLQRKKCDCGMDFDRKWMRLSVLVVTAELWQSSKYKPIWT